MKTILLRMLVGVALSLSAAQLGFADEKQAKELATQYLTALKSGDKAKVRAAWAQIDKDKDVKEYLLKNLPKVYDSYQMQKTAYQFQDLSERYFGKSDLAPGALAPVASGASQPGANAAGRSNNNDVSLSNSNQRQAPNQRQVQNFSNRSLQSNQDAIRNFSNQDQISNRDRIRSRLRSLR